MPSTAEIEAAGRALCEECALETYDKVSKSKYDGDARAALAAAEKVRDIERRENCKHPRKQGTGSISSDGTSCMRWHCQDCFKSWETASVGGLTRIG